MQNYTSYQIPNINSLLDAFSQTEQDRAGMTVEELIRSFGFKDEGGLAPFFNEMNMQPIEEGLGQIPQLQNFLHEGARGSWKTNMGLLRGQLGRKNFASIGADDYTSQIDRQFSNDMLSADKQIQSLVDRFRGMLGDQFESQRQSAQQALAGGAELWG